MSRGRGKRLVYVPEELVQGLMEASRNEGKSVSKLVEESLRQTVKANLLGYNPRQVGEILEVLHTHRTLGGAFVPQDVLNLLIENAYKAEKEQLQTKWYESGKWYGKYLKEKFENPVQAFKTFLEATRWDLNEVELKQNENEVKLRCISTTLTAEGTELLAKFIEGAIRGIGYQTLKTDCMRGMIVLQFKCEA